MLEEYGAEATSKLLAGKEQEPALRRLQGDPKFQMVSRPFASGGPRPEDKPLLYLHNASVLVTRSQPRGAVQFAPAPARKFKNWRRQARLCCTSELHVCSS